MSLQRNKLLCIYTLFLATNVIWSQQDFLSALNNIQHLLSPENDLGDLVLNFIQNQNIQMDQLKIYIEMFAKFQEIAGSNKFGDLVENPINFFMYVKRFVEDWKDIEELFRNSKVDDEALKKLSQMMTGSIVSTEDDLNEAALVVVRLQDVYNLNTSHIRLGKLGNLDTNKPLTANECLRLAQQALYNFHLDLALSWFEEGLKLAKKEVNANHINTKKTITQMKQLKTLLKESLGLMTPEIMSKLSSIPGVPTENFHRLLDREDETHPSTMLMNLYKGLCRGEVLMPIELSSHLHCMFVPHDFTRDLQRAKVEFLSFKPLVAVLHQVVSDKEIEKIKELSIPTLEDAKILNSANKNMRESPVRSGKTAWLSSNSDPMIKKLYQKVEDFTGLSTKNAEDLQVVRYGMGGHFDMHVDYFNTYIQKNELVSSDRVATFLLYLSNVSNGGGTVFPHLHIAVKPEKGSALFWYNLLRSGEGDMRMVHAACPVLSTNKWIANLWLAEADQMLHRPCALNRNE